MNRKLLIPFAIVIISLFSVNAFAQGTIGIIVNKDLYSSVQAAVDVYAADVEKIEKKSVWLNTTTFSESNTCQQMKDSLTAHYDSDNLEGVVLIGDLPVAEYTSSDFFGERDQYVCDLYYMDLNGSFSGSGSVFSNHSGDKEAEIWVSRLTGSVLESYFGDEVTLVNDYFARVKGRMYGQDPMERKYVIAGQKSEWGGLEAENQGDFGYDPANIDCYTGSCGSQWSAALVDGREYGFVYSHSSPTMHAIGFDISDQRDVDMDCRFFNSYACSNADFDRANMCGGYAMADAGLICVGSAKTGSMIPGSFRAYNRPIGEGDCFGEAFRKWFNDEGIDNVYWHYGMNLQGVGTLVLEPYASGPYLTVNSPNGGEEWEQGNTYDIKWGSNVDGNVKIELLKGGSVYKTIESSIANSGLYSLEVTKDFDEGDDYKIKISSLEIDTILSESAENFSIIAEVLFDDFPYVQKFDDMDTTRELSEYWEQLSDDDQNWDVQNGPTPSKVSPQGGGTGPDGDHTSGNGNYVYVEATSNSNNKAHIMTPKFDLRGLTDPVLTFWCHMFSEGNNMGDLYVDISVDGDWNNDVIHLTDDHGDAWFEVEQDLSDYVGNRVRFRFRGIVGTDYDSDICMDDFTIDGSTEIAVPDKLPSSFGLRYYGSRIYFQIPEQVSKNHVSIKLYNIQGKVVRTLVDGTVSPGEYNVSLSSVGKNGKQLAAGLYLCRMEAKGFTKTINLLLRK